MWTQNIIQEPKELLEEPIPSRKHVFGPLNLRLFFTSSIGFLLQLFTVLHPTLRLEMIFPTASWAIGCILLAIFRPKTAPKPLLVLYCSIFVSQFFVLIDTATEFRTNDIPILLGLITALGAITIILNMPLRDPLLPSEKISPAFGPPTSDLRSPEDNLTMWQFMTVSWMAPLISLGNSRQLNDEDVWYLGYEFQHRLLLDKFRDIQGTVFRRLLEANGIDLIILSVLSIIELIASTKSSSHNKHC